MVLILIGIAGTLLILLAFLMNELGKWNRKTFRFELTNAIGAILLVIYAIIIKGYPFLILNAIWALISIWYAIKDLIEKK